MQDGQPVSDHDRPDGLNDYAWASQTCVSIRGFLLTAAELIGAAKEVKLESTIDDNPTTAKGTTSVMHEQAVILRRSMIDGRPAVLKAAGHH